MKKILFILLSISLILISCRNDDHEDEPGARINDQTLFMYMPWSTDLTSYFQVNLSDFEKAMQKDILKNTRVLVFFSTSLKEALLLELKYENGRCTRTTLKEYDETELTTARGVTSILNDVKALAPANRYAMTVSCHGMGWIPVSPSSSRSVGEKNHWEHEGVPLTRFFGGRNSNCQIDVTTFAKGISDAGIKMEYILFDDCYMSTIEVAYDLKDVTDYLIASPTEVMAYGFPYHIIGEHLVGKVNYAGISNGFHTFYEGYAMPCGTIAVTKCAELENLASIMKEINQRFTFDPNLRSSLQILDGYSPVIFYDFGDYVSKLCTDPELLDSFEKQLERAIPDLLKKHTRSYYSMGRGEVSINTFSGATISDPSTSSRAASKTNTTWYKATH